MCDCICGWLKGDVINGDVINGEVMTKGRRLHRRERRAARREALPPQTERLQRLTV